MASRDTIWVLGDQLGRHLAALRDADPATSRILMIESEAKLASKRWHRQRLHLVLASMRRFAGELRDAGFDVDYRRAKTFAAGLRAHRKRHRPASVRATEPASWDGWRTLRRLGVALVRSNQFLCHADEFADWAEGRSRLRMEDFYRWQRRRLGLLLEDGAPAGGRWNYDTENREPAPADATWPDPPRSTLDELDREVVASLPPGAFGVEPDGTWATTRRAALARLRHFVTACLPRFGPHQDAMTERSWHLAHSLLSPYLNLGMLHPAEVCAAAETEWHEGRAPLASVEGFIRQVAGWREFVWGTYWLWMPKWRKENALGARLALPPVYRGEAETRMRCLAAALESVERHAYAHHIQRLMILGNLSLLAGVRPRELVEWMWASFVDGAEWVMWPNAGGMALYADGGRMTTKPYAAGGSYVRRMSDHCAGCEYDPAARTGDDACPLTTLYWAFLDRHRERLAGNHRLRVPLAALRKRRDLDAIRARATVVLDGLRRGRT